MSGAKRKGTPAAEMVTFVPDHDFEGYPDGRTPVWFRAGVKSDPVPVAYLETLRAAGRVPAEPAKDDAE